MINGIISWWKRQPLIVKIFSGIFVGSIIVIVAIFSLLIRGRGIDSTVFDDAVNIYEKQSEKRIEALIEQKEKGIVQEKAADKRINELDSSGSDASKKREVRNDDIKNSDSWRDLDSELGSPRNSGRRGSKN